MPELLPVPVLEPELGAVVLPEELWLEPGPQSFIADFEPVELLLLPTMLDVPLLLVLDSVLALLDAELFGPQSGFIAPDIEPVSDLEPAPALVPALVPAPPLLLVCAMAAPPSVNARTETAVRRRRFIGFLHIW